MSRTIPLTVTLENGTKKIIGTAEISDDNESVSATITDPDYADIFGGDVRQFSIERPEGPIHHNVFEKDE